MSVRRNAQGRRRSTTTTHRPHGRRPMAELLEGRVLLAGNVITTPPGSPNSPGAPAPQLLIQGDGFDNEIMIKKGTAPDEIVVNGLNGTLVNGSTQEWHFNGVQALQAAMGGGNDKVDLRNLTLSGEPDPLTGSTTGQVIVDGGQGDDRITMFNTTIDASAPPPDPDVFFFPTSAVGVMLFGETSALGDTSGTGNDFIEVSNTTIIADGGEMTGSSLIIYGEQNGGGTITGGNDHINVTNTVIRATNTSLAASAQAAVQIVGDSNLAGTGSSSVIGQGNDWIDVNGTDIIATSAQGSGGAFIQVIGDGNQASGNGSATIGNFGTKTGGDDTINLTNATLSASGANFSNNSVVVDIQGELNFADAATATATVGSGNDTITVNNYDVNASGTMSDNSAHLGIFGDGDYLLTGPLNFGRVGRGNDTIYVQNTDVTGTGALSNNTATLELYSDDRTQTPETSTLPGEGTRVGEGTDNVQLSSFLLHGSTSANVQMHTRKGNDVIDVLNIEVGGFGMTTGTGDDDVDVLNSEWGNGNWDLEAGNDLLKMNGNFFVMTDANGGAGIDRLQAGNNTGLLVPVSFEQFN